MIPGNDDAGSGTSGAAAAGEAETGALKEKLDEAGERVGDIRQGQDGGAARAEIDRLASHIVAACPGEPSQEGSVVDTAIRLIDERNELLKAPPAAGDLKRLQDHIAALPREPLPGEESVVDHAIRLINSGIAAEQVGRASTGHAGSSTDQTRKYRLTAVIEADTPDKLAALAKQLSVRYGDGLQIGPNTGDFVQNGDMANCTAHLDVKADEPAAAQAADGI